MELDKLKYLIRLQLNPREAHDKEIERLIDEIPKLAIPTEFTTNEKKEELKRKLNDLIMVSQKLLKVEWEKVKDESKRGDLKKSKEEPGNCLSIIFKELNNHTFQRLNKRCLEVTSKWTKNK